MDGGNNKAYYNFLVNQWSFNMAAMRSASNRQPDRNCIHGQDKLRPSLKHKYLHGMRIIFGIKIKINYTFAKGELNVGEYLSKKLLS